MLELSHDINKCIIIIIIIIVQRLTRHVSVIRLTNRRRGTNRRRMYVFLMFVTFSGTVCTCEFYLLFVWFMCMCIWAKYLK